MVLTLLILQALFMSSLLGKQDIFTNRSPKRNLQSYATPELSQLSGNGTVEFYYGEQVEITVSTYD